MGNVKLLRKNVDKVILFWCFYCVGKIKIVRKMYEVVEYGDFLVVVKCKNYGM